MVRVLTVTLAATGVPQPLAGVNAPASYVTLQADLANTAVVYHGPANVTTSTGQAIIPGGGGGSPQYPVHSGQVIYDLATIYVIGTQNDIVRVMYGRF